MRKIRCFLMVVALVVALLSCVQPGTPEGEVILIQTQPGNTVIAQLEWLRDNAQSNGNYIVVAREHEPRIPGNNNFGITYGERENITVTIQSAANIPRQTLRLLDDGVMLNVGANHTLILQNINLRVPLDVSEAAFEAGISGLPIVQVNGGTLQMINSTISGNMWGHGVIVDAEGALIMGSGAVIYNNGRTDGSRGGGVFVNNGSRIYMYGNALIRNNMNTPGDPDLYWRGGGVTLYDNAVLTMRGSSVIQDNITLGFGGGVSVYNDSHVFMYDNAVIRGNSANRGGGVFINRNSTLNMHSNNTHISVNNSTSYHGGGVLSGTTDDNKINISGGIIHGINAAPHLANTARLDGAALHFSDNVIRVGSYCPSSGFDHRTELSDIVMEHTLSVVNGFKQGN